MKSFILAGLLLCSAVGQGRAAIEADEEQEVPKERFTDPQQNFQRVKDTLLKKYYRDNLTEEDLYRAAVQGMLHFLDPRMRAWNRLLSPGEIAEIQNDLHGEIVGIGVVIKFDPESGISDVLGTIPGSPAEKAGLREGDKIVTVNGKLYKGHKLRDVVFDIRGKTGQSVKLTLLRGAELLSRQVVREKVTYEQVTSQLLPGGVGYVQIHSFNEATPEALRAALTKLLGGKARALIIDVRDNQGGLFDKAVEAAGLLLPRGKTVVRIVGRGGKEEVLTSKGEPVVSGLPVAVLVNGSTSSGAEFFTAALRENLAAQVVGNKTLGKWSVQRLDDLPNHYAIKYTTSLFRSPSGKSYEGEGLPPDVDVDMDSKQLEKVQRITSPEKRLAQDGQLRTAYGLIRPRP